MSEALIHGAGLDLVAEFERFDTDMVSQRLWDGDPTLWGSPDTPELVDRLGWLSAPDRAVQVGAIAWATDVVLLGMGGSSLAPEMFSQVLESTSARLHVVDTTHPAAIANVRSDIAIETTVFVVASKSGGTLETMSLLRFFWAEASEMTDQPGRHFVAITDPGSGLSELADERGFASTYLADPTVGGRYSALTAFGQVPARLAGIDIDAVLASAVAMSRLCGPHVSSAAHPALQMAAFISAAHRQGSDKVSVVCSKGLAAFGPWFEQLLAESTGKDGKGALPVAGESVDVFTSADADRVIIRYGLVGDDELSDLDLALDATGLPVMRIDLRSPHEIGAEIFRAEFATAVVGHAIGIHPFDQPDVQAAKTAAAKAMDGSASDTDSLPVHAASEDGLDAFGHLVDGAARPQYIALMAYVERTPESEELIAGLQQRVGHRTGCVTTAGFGPRFLHSTGQYHKGGPNTALCVQILDRQQLGGPLPVPETDFTFDELIAAQAAGDAAALVERGRTVIRIGVNDFSEVGTWFDATV